IVVDPACFGPSAVRDHLSREGAERILKAARGNEAALGNAILLSGSPDPEAVAILQAVQRLSTPLRQSLQILASELAKRGDACFASIPMPPPSQQHLDNIRQIAKALRADIVICASAQDATVLTDLQAVGIEVCTPEQYSLSRTEAKRESWLA